MLQKSLRFGCLIVILMIACMASQNAHGRRWGRPAPRTVVVHHPVVVHPAPVVVHRPMVVHRPAYVRTYRRVYQPIFVW